MKVAIYEKTARYDQNYMKSSGSKPKCIVCGKNVGENAKEVEITNFGDLIVLEGEDNSEHSLGWFDIGPDCHKRLMKGAFDSKEDAMVEVIRISKEAARR